MKKRYCPDCEKEVDVIEETIGGNEYLSCSKCATVIAEIKFDWELPVDKTNVDSV